MPLGAVRPDDWNFPLLVHVLGAMLLVGALSVVIVLLLTAWRREGAGALVATRLAFRSLLLGALPAYVVMRVGAEWIASRENLSDSEAAWIGIGYVTSDAGALLLLISLVLTGAATRRAGRGGRALPRAASVLVSLMLAAYLVAVWAMTAKPS